MSTSTITTKDVTTVFNPSEKKEPIRNHGGKTLRSINNITGNRLQKKINYKTFTIFILLFQASMYSLVAQGMNTPEYDGSKESKPTPAADQLHHEAETYRRKELIFRDKARWEDVELARRIKQADGRMYKYPSPVDSARYLYQYYTAKAEEMEKKAQLLDSQTTSMP